MVQAQQVHRPPLRSVSEAYVKVTAAAYTAKAGDRVIGVNRAGAVTITLPSSEVRKGRTYTIKDESGAAAVNNITVAAEGPEKIDDSATDVISENYGGKSYYSDGSNWFELPFLASPGPASTAGTAASTTAAGIVELATTAETNAGADRGRAVTPDGLAGSVHGEVVVQMVVFDFTANVAAGAGKFYIHIDSKLNHMNLVRTHAEVIIAGIGGATEIQIANVTDSVDILSTKLTIDSGETGSDTADAAAVINTANDDVATNDVLRVDVDTVSTTPPKGLIVTLSFRLP